MFAGLFGKSAAPGRARAPGINLEAHLSTSFYYDDDSGKSYSIEEFIKLRTGSLEEQGVYEKLKGRVVKARNTAGLLPRDLPGLGSGGTPDNRAIESIISKKIPSGFQQGRLIYQPPLVNTRIELVYYDSKKKKIRVSKHRARLPVAMNGAGSPFAGKGTQAKYTPSFKVAGHEKGLLGACLDLAQHKDESKLELADGSVVDAQPYRDVMATTAMELHDVARDYYYGAYSIDGLIKRFKDTAAVYEAVKGANEPTYSKDAYSGGASSIPLHNRDPPLIKSLADYISTGMGKALMAVNEAFPFNPPTDLGKIFTYNRIDVVSAKWCDLFGGNPPAALLRLNPKAGAGPLFPGKKHKDVWASEVEMANRLLVDCGLRASGSMSAGAFASKWDFARLANFIPKSEVYERPTKDKPTKVRIVNGTNTFAYLPLAVLRNATAAWAAPYWAHPTSQVMAKFSVFKGGMNTFIKNCQSLSFTEGLTHDWYIYSDNIYLVGDIDGHRVIVSLDGVKMEASHTPVSIALMAHRIAAKFKAAGFGRKSQYNMSSAWLSYLYQVVPDISVNTVGVLGTSQVRFPGMASGVVNTFENNTTLMAMLTSAARRALPKGTAPEDAVKRILGVSSLGELLTLKTPKGTLADACVETGVKLTVENTLSFHAPAPGGRMVPTLPAGVKVRSAPRTLAYRQEALTKTEEAQRPFSVRRADILGYDLVTVPLPEGGVVYLAALARPRLVKALTFSKSALRDLGVIKGSVAIAGRIITLRTLYAIGGYAHADLTLIIGETIRRLRASLGDDILTAIERDDEEVGKIVENVLAREMPDNQTPKDLKELRNQVIVAVSENRHPTLAEIVALHLPSSDKGYNTRIGTISAPTMEKACRWFMRERFLASLRDNQQATLRAAKEAYTATRDMVSTEANEVFDFKSTDRAECSAYLDGLLDGMGGTDEASRAKAAVVFTLHDGIIGHGKRKRAFHHEAKRKGDWGPSKYVPGTRGRDFMAEIRGFYAVEQLSELETQVANFKEKARQSLDPFQYGEPSSDSEISITEGEFERIMSEASKGPGSGPAKTLKGVDPSTTVGPAGYRTRKTVRIKGKVKKMVREAIEMALVPDEDTNLPEGYRVTNLHVTRPRGLSPIVVRSYAANTDSIASERSIHGLLPLALMEPVRRSLKTLCEEREGGGPGVPRDVVRRTVTRAVVRNVLRTLHGRWRIKITVNPPGEKSTDRAAEEEPVTIGAFGLHCKKTEYLVCKGMYRRMPRQQVAGPKTRKVRHVLGSSELGPKARATKRGGKTVFHEGGYESGGGEEQPPPEEEGFMYESEGDHYDTDDFDEEAAEFAYRAYQHNKAIKGDHSHRSRRSSRRFSDGYEE